LFILKNDTVKHHIVTGETKIAEHVMKQIYPEKTEKEIILETNEMEYNFC